MSNSNSSVTRGVHHLGLTSPDLERTRDFFVEVLRFEQIGEVPDYPAVFLSDGSVMLTLWQAEDPASAAPFDRKRVVGLHHFASASTHRSPSIRLFALLLFQIGPEHLMSIG